MLSTDLKKFTIAIAVMAMLLILAACGNAQATPVPATEAPAGKEAPTVAIASPTPAPTNTPAAEKAKDTAKDDKKEDEKPMAYDFTAKNLLTGETFSLSDYRGKIVFLNFWGSWCPPCRMEMPGFQNIYEKYGDDVVIIGVGINDSKGNLIEFAKSIGVTYPIVHDRTSEIARHYRIRSLPTTYRIDQEGRVQGVAVGALTEDQLTKAIEELLPKQ